MMAGAFLVFRTGTVGTAIYTFNNLFSVSFDIVDSNDRTLLGSPKRGDYNRSWEWKDQFINFIASNTALYHVTHAASLRSVVDSGVMTGFNYYDNNTRIKITTDASWVAGFKTVDLFFKQYAMLRIMNGRIQPPLLLKCSYNKLSVNKSHAPQSYCKFKKSYLGESIIKLFYCFCHSSSIES